MLGCVMIRRSSWLVFHMRVSTTRFQDAQFVDIIGPTAKSNLAADLYHEQLLCCGFFQAIHKSGPSYMPTCAHKHIAKNNLTEEMTSHRLWCRSSEDTTVHAPAVFKARLPQAPNSSSRFSLPCLHYTKHTIKRLPLQNNNLEQHSPTLPCASPLPPLRLFCPPPRH
jgi:hypothetical protein